VSVESVWRRFFKAVHGCVTCNKPSLQNRLACVYEFDIAGIDNKDDEIPGVIWGRIESLCVAVTSQGSIEATTKVMTTEEAATWLHEVVEIFHDLDRVRYSSERNFPFASHDVTAVRTTNVY
jgi:hypothetical protein